MLFERFDRLLFLAKGGKTVYFGEVGKDSQTLIDYFQRNGGHACPPGANPAEWMLEVIGAAPGSSTDIDWHSTWKNSQEYQGVRAELDRLKTQKPKETDPLSDPKDKASYRPFAAPWGVQLREVLKRVLVQYVRTPSYIYAKILLVVAAALFVGFSFFRMPPR